MAAAVALAGAALALLLAATFPPEASLGTVYRLVVFHGGLAIVALALLAADGLAGLATLVRPSATLSAVTASGQEAAALAFALYFASSMLSMQLAWGGILWREPRFVAAVWILFVGGAAFIASLVWDRTRVRAAAAALVGVFATAMVARAGLTFHPASAIGGSADLIARMMFAAIVASLFVAALAFWVVRFRAWRRHHLAAGAPLGESD